MSPAPERPAGRTAGAVRAHVVCAASELSPGQRRIVELDGSSVGVFNVAGTFYALRNRCPHRGGPLCLGPVAGTVLPTDDRSHPYGREGEILRCAWHGWEFDLRTGRALGDPSVCARAYRVTVEDGQVVVST
jgi:nitrite reductase (NADH) small subunit